MPTKRGVPSEVFRSVMENAKKRLLLESDEAGTFEHKGLLGDERAASLAKFFRERIGDRFDVQKGEAIDYQDTRTGQLDFVIYDRSRCAPIHMGKENLLLPREALYCVIEVKTRVTQDELDTAYSAAGKVRALRPFKKPFVASRQDGASAVDSRDRCLFVIFGYTSNLGNDSDWAAKEYHRLHKAAKSRCLNGLRRSAVYPRPGNHKSAETGWEMGRGRCRFRILGELLARSEFPWPRIGAPETRGLADVRPAPRQGLEEFRCPYVEVVGRDRSS
jgi:hypothetical protein